MIADDPATEKVVIDSTDGRVDIIEEAEVEEKAEDDKVTRDEVAASV